MTLASFDSMLLRSNEDHIFLRSNPGSRKLQLSKALVEKYFKSAHQISKNLLLIQAETHRAKEAWILMNLRGQVMDINIKLGLTLMSERSWTKVSSCVLWDGRCCLLLEKIETNCNQCYAIIITISQSGDLESYERVSIPGNSSIEFPTKKRSSNLSSILNNSPKYGPIRGSNGTDNENESSDDS